MSTIDQAVNKQMANKNRYKFHFGEKNLTLTTDKDNLFMEEVERVAYETVSYTHLTLPTT